MTLTLAAPVKVNLALHVGPPRADGYHPVDTLCVFPAMGDLVTYEREGAPGIDFTGPYGPHLAEEGQATNLIWLAFLALGVEPEGRFLLTKMMPVASGVGSGTADGVAAMLILNMELGLGLDADALIARAIALGADGPICMASQIYGGGLIRARGIGERVQRLGRVEPMGIVLANPRVHVSTAAVFRAFDDTAPEALGGVETAHGRNLPALVAANRNDLLLPAEEIAPEIATTLAALSEQPGARAVQMSGSGATCFALHASESSAAQAARALRGQGFWAESSFILAG
ncbi:MAG: 4-(cytidine 5'-diphospho)-2-C-methyl-D-erythritol kinase [Parvularcula sp.]|jgi:4-diphosphocytidyl-2-C-methyl-D-erythritol kinase|nr:4-(cytidine 5'-diphospho)-2-C-methyl-D-erythritol kinase [Parvularcula sp.]